MRPGFKWIWRLGIVVAFMTRPVVGQPFAANVDEESPQRPAGFSIKKEDQKDDAKFKSLVKIYETMKPK